jgi:hypothetical protein
MRKSRVALVIGNGAYRHAEKLANPVSLIVRLVGTRSNTIAGKSR